MEKTNIRSKICDIENKGDKNSHLSCQFNSNRYIHELEC